MESEIRISSALSTPWPSDATAFTSLLEDAEETRKEEKRKKKKKRDWVDRHYDRESCYHDAEVHHRWEDGGWDR